MKKPYPLSKVYGLLEPGPVVLVTTAQKGRANVMTLSWLTMMDFEAPLVGPPLMEECYASLECRVTDARMAKRYNFFVLEVLKAWIDPARKHPRTIHHLGKGRFVVDGRPIPLPSRMK